MSARSDLEFSVSEIESELSVSQQHCRELKEKVANIEDQLTTIITKNTKV